MNKNDRFTSNTQKLIANLDRFLVFQKTRKLHPITLDVAPSNNCNLNCEFCSVKNRDKNVSLRLDQAIHCTEMYLKRGLKAVELTGGGEPLTWP